MPSGRPVVLGRQQLAFCLGVASGLTPHQASRAAGYRHKQGSRLSGKRHLQVGIDFCRVLAPELREALQTLVQDGDNGQTLSQGA